MPVSEALEFFEAVPRIARKLRTLDAVGLGYVRLGQQATTLSGGEAQRVKLSKELSRPGTGQTLYILDEPTTGLHFEDIRHLLHVLQALVNKGNTVLVIEHNMDVAKSGRPGRRPRAGRRRGRRRRSSSPGRRRNSPRQDTPTARFIREELERTRHDERVGSSNASFNLDDMTGDDDEASEDEIEDEEPEESEAVV